MLAVIFGINGVGKTSVVQNVLKNTDFERIHWGSVSEKLAKERGLIENIDQIRKLNVKVQKELQSEAAKSISELVNSNPGKNYLLETHSALKTPQGFLPGFNQEILNLLKPGIFIVIEADANAVFQRRQNDTTRTRDDDASIEDVQKNLEATRWYASTFAVMSAATLFIVENKQGDVNFAAEEITKMLKRF